MVMEMFLGYRMQGNVLAFMGSWLLTLVSMFSIGLQKAAGVLPLTQGINLMKAVSMGAELENVWKIVVLLVGITLICSVVSVKTFRWE